MNAILTYAFWAIKLLASLFTLALLIAAIAALISIGWHYGAGVP